MTRSGTALLIGDEQLKALIDKHFRGFVSLIGYNLYYRRVVALHLLLTDQCPRSISSSGL